MNTRPHKIELTDTIKDAIFKLCEGNPGAISVMANMVKYEPQIDPDCMFIGFGSILCLDSLNIYGSRIWMLYKDVCGENIVNTIGILRANQLGFLEKQTLDDAIDGKSTIDISTLMEKVKERLPLFDRS